MDESGKVDGVAVIGCVIEGPGDSCFKWSENESVEIDGDALSNGFSDVWVDSLVD